MTRPVSISELRTFRRCRRKWWLAYHRQLKFRRPDVVGAAQLGTLVHLALEAYYAVGTELDPQRAYDAMHQRFIEDAASLVRWREEDPDARTAEADRQHMELVKQHELATIMLQGYFDWLEETAVDANLEVVAVEEQVRIPFTEQYDLQGKLDKRVRRLDSGFTAFLDHKTVGSLTDIPKTAQMNEQGLMYCVLLRLKYPDLLVDGEIFNLLRKVKRTARANPPFYGRHEVRWNRDELNNFYVRLHGIVQDLALVEALLAADVDPYQVVYPNPTSDCSWDCEFLPVCSMIDDGSRAEAMLSEYYVKHDPYERYAATSTEGTT